MTYDDKLTAILDQHSQEPSDVDERLVAILGKSSDVAIDARLEEILKNCGGGVKGNPGFQGGNNCWRQRANARRFRRGGNERAEAERKKPDDSKYQSPPFNPGKKGKYESPPFNPHAPETGYRMGGKNRQKAIEEYNKAAVEHANQAAKEAQQNGFISKEQEEAISRRMEEHRRRVEEAANKGKENEKAIEERMRKHREMLKEDVAHGDLQKLRDEMIREAEKAHAAKKNALKEVEIGGHKLSGGPAKIDPPDKMKGGPAKTESPAKLKKPGLEFKILMDPAQKMKGGAAKVIDQWHKNVNGMIVSMDPSAEAGKK